MASNTEREELFREQEGFAGKPGFYPAIAGVYGVLAPYRYSQEEITEWFVSSFVGADKRALARRLQLNTRVSARNLSMPLENYVRLTDFGELNQVFIANAVRMGAAAVTGALMNAGITAEEVDLIESTTVTGVAAPSIDTGVVSVVGLRPDVKRIPMFGLGCAAGAAGIGRLNDYLRGHPDQVGVLLSVELCSLTLQHDDHSVANLIAAGLFGDGAAAVVAVGANRAAHSDVKGPKVIDSRSHLYPDTERLLGMSAGSGGLKVVLDESLPDIVRQNIGDDVGSFLGDHGLCCDDIAMWAVHPGGPKILEAVESELKLASDALRLSWHSLADVGNLSSSSVLHILRDIRESPPPPGGTPGFVIGMGPGFCTELVLLEW